jgi:hypothetical protein
MIGLSRFSGWPVHCRRFAGAFAGVRARLAADANRYPFIVRDLHPLLLAGLPPHSENPVQKRKSLQPTSQYLLLLRTMVSPPITPRPIAESGLTGTRLGAHKNDAVNRAANPISAYRHQLQRGHNLAWNLSQHQTFFSANEQRRRPGAASAEARR